MVALLHLHKLAGQTAGGRDLDKLHTFSDDLKQAMAAAGAASTAM